LSEQTLKVRCSDAAVAMIEEIASSSPEAYVEISALIKIIRVHGFVGEERIAILNDQYDVYLLKPAPPGWPMIMLKNPNNRGESILANVGRFSDSTALQRKQLAIEAAKAINLAVTDVYVIPK
jgi:hypothetical protein